MFGRISIPWHSIRFKLIMGFLIIMLPLIGLLLYNNHYSVNVIHKQVATTNKNLMSIYMKQIDDQLSEVERQLMGLTQTEPHLLTMGKQVGQDDYVMAKSSVSRRLVSDLIVYPYIDGFFVYSLPRRDIVDAAKYAMSYDELMNMRQALEGRVMKLAEQPSHLNVEWTVHEINGAYHFLRMFRSGEIFIGAWVRVATMIDPLRELQTGDTGAVLFVDGEGAPLYSTKPLADLGLDFTRGFDDYYLSGQNQDYLIVGESSRKGELSLAAAIPDQYILENIPYLANVSRIVILMAVAMLLMSLWFFRRVLLLPLRKMMTAMRLIGEGNLNAHIEESPVPDEFLLVNRTFNRMITQIESLKIDVYEEQLQKQRAELKHLQLQINPHFFMNSLNILYNLAQTKQNDLIQDMTMCLVQYFRYMFQSNHPLVLLRDELKHIRNYLQIQEVRLPNRLHCDIQVPPFLEETPIPPLLLQTIVENTMKHGVQMEGSIHLTIEAVLDTPADEPMVCITVRDTGKGFSDEALEHIRSGHRIVDDAGEHIGLWNVRERLRLQFGAQAWMDCYNDDPQGAVTEIGIPLHANTAPKEETSHATNVDRR